MKDQDELTVALWRMRCELVTADREICSFRQFHSARTDWLRFNRTSLLFSIVHASELCGVTRATYDELEKREIKGQITLAKLRTAAEALGCELVYVIRPRDGKTFAESSWARFADDVEAKSARMFCLPHMRARLKIAIASLLLSSEKNLKRFRVNRRLWL